MMFHFFTHYIVAGNSAKRDWLVIKRFLATGSILQISILMVPSLRERELISVILINF